MKLDVSRTMTLAGREIRLALKRIYGTPEAAEKAIRARAEDTESLEQWATLTDGQVFLFDDVPPAMRDSAILSMAAAMLVWTEEQERGVA